MPPRRQPTPFESAVTSQPFFGGAREPQMFQPFNVGGVFGGGAAGVGANMVLPLMAQQFMGAHGMVPSQFLPTQNLYDQFASQQYHAQQQQAMALASKRDQVVMSQTLIGGLRMMQGSNPTLQQQQQAFGAAGQLTSMLPTLSMFLGPEMIDSMFGSRGSAMLLGQSIHRGGRTSRDPLTGQIGFSGRTSGGVATEIFENLYGVGANVNGMRGLSAGGAGQLFEQLQLRGMAGPSLGAMSPEARMRALSKADFGQQEQVRVAESSLRRQGRDVNADTIEAARERIFDGPGSTLGQIQRAGDARRIEPAELAALRNEEGSEELLTTAQAQRITGRLKNLAGAVSAMRDIFGDMGHPDAPMREIINGLEALTQGGLASMSPGRIEQMVRTTKNLAQQSGLGISGMMGMQAQAGNLADQLGLDRSLAVQATQGAAAFAGAARDTMRLDIPAFGGLTAEQATLLDQQLRLTGQASQVGNVLNASVRMLQEGVVTADSDAGLLAQAVMKGETTFVTKGGQTRNVHMSNSEWVKLQRQSGASGVTANSVISDRFMNQQYGRDFKTGELTRQIQLDKDIIPRVANSFANVLAGQFAEGGLNDVLKAQGLEGNALRRETQVMAGQLAERFFDMDSATARSIPAKNKFMADAMRSVLESNIRRRGKAAGLGEDAIQANVDNAMANMTDEQALQTSVAMRARLNSRIPNDEHMRGYKSDLGLHQMHNRVTQEQQRGRLTEAVTKASMQSAFSHLGRVGPLRRLSDELQRGGTDSFGTILGRVFGGIDKKVLAQLKDGPLGALRDLSNEFGNAERYTEASSLRVSAERQAAMDAGLSVGDYRKRIDAGVRETAIDTLVGDADFRKRVDGEVQARIPNLTERGVQQRILTATMIKGMMIGGPAAEQAKSSLAAFLGTDVAGIGQNLEGRITTAKGADKRRLEALQRGFTAIDQGVVVQSLMENLGMATGQQVSTAEVSGLVEQGDDTMKRIMNRKEGDKNEQQEIQDAATRFLKSTRELGMSLLASPKDLEQLGAGGMARLKSVRDEQAKLDKLAKAAGVSVGELLAGNVNDKHADKVLEARLGMDNITDQMREIEKIKIGGVMPGSPGTDREHELPTTKREKAVATALQKFMVGQEFSTQLDSRKFKTSKAQSEEVKKMQARSVAKDLAGLMSPDMRGKIVDENGNIVEGSGLVDMLKEGDRSFGVFQSMQARKQLAAMERDGGDMKSSEAIRLKRLAAPLEGIKGDENFQELRDRVEKFSSVKRLDGGGAGGKDDGLKVKITGTLKLTEDNRAEIAGDGDGDLAHNDVWTKGGRQA